MPNIVEKSEAGVHPTQCAQSIQNLSSLLSLEDTELITTEGKYNYWDRYSNDLMDDVEKILHQINDLCEIDKRVINSIRTAIRQNEFDKAINIASMNAIANIAGVEIGKTSMTPEELAQHHMVSEVAINRELRKGIKVEMEHTNSPRVARDIALDHIRERYDYYTMLEEMEQRKTSWHGDRGGSQGRDVRESEIHG